MKIEHLTLQDVVALEVEFDDQPQAEREKIIEAIDTIVGALKPLSFEQKMQHLRAAALLTNTPFPGDQ